jgi:serine phosphatase RsbU (regulator of sigma subunit)
MKRCYQNVAPGPENAHRVRVRASSAIGIVLALVGAGIALASAALAMRGLGAGLCVAGVLLAAFSKSGGGGGDGRQILLEQDLAVARSQLVQVTEQATRLAKGEALSVEGSDETLASLHQVAGKMKSMVEARVHIVATERDMEQARRMYRTILPLSSATDHGALSLAGSCAPAAETGGDWWTYRKLANGKMLVIIGDATGHGVHSAMVGCMAHGAVRALTQLGEDFLGARRVLDAVHTAIRIPGVEHASMTLFACTIDPKARTVQYVNHGHVFPLIAVRDTAGTITEVMSITGEREIDDEVDDSIELDIRAGTAKLEPGNVLICFTDGLIERAKNNRPFGARRLAQALVGASVPEGVDGLSKLRDRVLERVDQYVDRAPLEDDITLVMCSVSANA